MTEKTGSLIGRYSCGSKGWFFLPFIVKRICRQPKRFISDQGEIVGMQDPGYSAAGELRKAYDPILLKIIDNLCSGMKIMLKINFGQPIISWDRKLKKQEVEIKNSKKAIGQASRRILWQFRMCCCLCSSLITN